MSEVVTNEIEFNLTKVLTVIEQDKDLDEIFRDDKITTPYNMLHTMAAQDAIPEEMIERAKGIFDHIILGNQKPRMAYLKLLRTETTNADSVAETIEETIQNVEESGEETPQEDDAPKYKLPKHYGKERILKDIEENNGKTELDTAMLALNDFRNIYAKLKNRCIKDKLRGTNILTQADCRDIVAVLRIVENKLGHIAKK
jgi:hypothetical protein